MKLRRIDSLPGSTCPDLDNIIELVESVRKANQALREAAETGQDLEDELDKAEERIKELECEVEDLLSEVEELEQRIAELEAEHT